MSRIRCYSELRRLETFEERFSYLSLKERVGNTTFGFDRWINQGFYHSREWEDARFSVILRDGGCDLGIPGREIKRGLLIHHMNPMSEQDIAQGEAWILNPEFLITTTKATHNALHYGNFDSLPKPFVERVIGDTTPWRRRRV
jgi:hypothetical protein